MCPTAFLRVTILVFYIMVCGEVGLPLSENVTGLWPLLTDSARPHSGRARIDGCERSGAERKAYACFEFLTRVFDGAATGNLHAVEVESALNV